MNLFKTSEIQKVRLYKIAKKMKVEKLGQDFIDQAVKLAEYYEGAYDLFCLWEDENNQIEKNNIVLDILGEIKENFDDRSYAND